MNAGRFDDSGQPLLEPLTRREQQVLELLADGLTSNEMSERLILAVSSVKWYVQQIYGKLGVNSKRQAITRAMHLGLLKAGEGRLAAYLEFPPSNTKNRPNNNLPLDLTSFIGRQHEIVQVHELLHAHRLVTLTGAGGVGKTRLTIQVAGEMLAETPDGVWYVELAPISDPELVPQIVAATFGLRVETNQPILETLSRFLDTRMLLIVLDNCEHLLEACARLADTLLRKAPRIRILTSSREALGIAGEYAFRVPSLAIPDIRQLPALEVLREIEAVRLFAERARMVQPTFTVSDHNAPAIVQICQRLDGIPLALELAAARLIMFTPEELATRLDNAFRILTGGSRTSLPRQQTLRATIDWSYALLSVQEQDLLRRLSVFAGGSTLAAIEVICTGVNLEAEQILDFLGGLIKKSMVSAERSEKGETRYRLLETVRQYARGKLNETEERQIFFDRHLKYYLELAEAIEPQLRTSAALEGLRRLEHEIDNMRSALSWALDETGGQKIEDELRLASALYNLWLTQAFLYEGYVWLKKGLYVEAIPVDPKVRAKACYTTGHLMFLLGRLAEAEQKVDESLAIYKRIEYTNGVVNALNLLGNIYAWNGYFEKANQASSQSLALCKTINDPWLLAWTLLGSGLTLFLQSERFLARPFYEESAEIFRQLGDPLHVSEISQFLGGLKFEEGDLIGSHEYFMKALASAKKMQSKFDEASALVGLGIVAYMQGDFQQMHSDLSKSLILQREIGSATLGDAVLLMGTAEINLGHPRHAAPLFKECLHISWVSDNYADNPLFENVAASLIGIARTALHTNQARTAAYLLATGKRLIDGKKHLYELIEQKEYELGWAELKDRLGELEVEQALSEGEALSLVDVVALALNLNV